MQKTILHIGSNVGDAKANLDRCVELIKERIGECMSLSSIYLTQAWGLEDQNDFLNQALEISTTLGLELVLEKCIEIEAEMGREKNVKWGPRIIDIDIIFYGEEVMESTSLTVPHPRMHNRNFVLYPLAEIIPEWKHPILGKSIAELKESSSDQQIIIDQY